jgi:hypothetical protein
MEYQVNLVVPEVKVTAEIVFGQVALSSSHPLPLNYSRVSVCIVAKDSRGNTLFRNILSPQHARLIRSEGLRVSPTVLKYYIFFTHTFVSMVS